MVSPPQRRSPEELLRQIQAEERAASSRGYLKIFLGYASGVGKTVRMFEEARRRRERGQDVVVGAVQPRIPPDLEPVLRSLEVVPMKSAVEIDVDALIARHPAICIIDGLAYNNPPGARNPARWMDVQELLAAGMKVIGSINVQYVEELRAEVEEITGKRVADTVPLSFIESADEIEIVDAESQDERMLRLREIALVLAADVVDRQLEDYLESNGIQQRLGTQERVLICMTPRANAREMIETGRVIADRFHGELIAAYVTQPEMSASDQAALDERLELARKAGATVETLDGEDFVETIMEFANARGITQIFVGHSQQSGLLARIRGNPVEQLIRKAEGIDIRVFPH